MNTKQMSVIWRESVQEAGVEEEQSPEIDYTMFSAVLPDICRGYSCPVEVITKKMFQDDTYYEALKFDPKARGRTSALASFSYPSASVGSEQSVDVTSLVVTTIYDTMENLVEIMLKNIQNIPIVVIQVIGLLATLQRDLNKFTISGCSVNTFTILELQQAIPKTTITEVCLENLNFSAANYAILLDAPTQLKCLTISRCKLNDEVCKTLASKLGKGMAAEKTLVTLNLSSNRITDKGMVLFSDALRTNRCLRHLNFAGNELTDTGAAYILDTLKHFPLTYDEIINRRERLFKQIHQQQILYESFFEQIKDDFVNTDKKRRYSYNPTLLEDKAKLMAEEAVNLNDDPYNSSNVKYYGNELHCMGNFTLCYLNLAYNNLSFHSLKNLLSVLKYQSSVLKNNDFGIMKVVLNGNNISKDCDYRYKINVYLQKNLHRLSSSYNSRSTKFK